MSACRKYVCMGDGSDAYARCPWQIWSESHCGGWWEGFVPADILVCLPCTDPGGPRCNPSLPGCAQACVAHSAQCLTRSGGDTERGSREMREASC